ncbi:hypothetical protein FRACYDRAFT_255480 [Fragilariopsis cylindrus CCMP1102]|uniref:Uncharacterized protein n=1 Tax=Fragilariopsis cylindrus CCMP1102 TaxID=635003 RepID=A0A1E7EK55_9STRA|nr:hypothetical protein FRACYDRAFT_255480 [Fragilariopsis cylindrus CCMP1102]|eukprot:OEU06254.1 hypothetical protein FRACYDRAFT_255480 [Fragilariopsis cylindrus CCMP1102]
MNSSTTNSPADAAATATAAMAATTAAAAIPAPVSLLPTTAQQQQQLTQVAGGKLQPQKLELILNPEDGSLMTAPLLSVVMACTDSLYRDLYDMAHGELVQIIAGGSGSGGATGGGPGDDDSPPDNSQGKRKDKMSNLSFVNRRHELSYRLATHSKALTHVAALTVSNSAGDQDQDQANKYNLTNYVNVSMNALTHARTAWIQNDECQDALYFFHGRLFSIRQGPHDIYGSLDFMCSPTTSTSVGGVVEEGGKGKASSFWYDLPSDLKLEIDRYEISKEKHWSKKEVSERWSMAVRRKLLLGEVGYYKNKNKSTTLANSSSSSSCSLNASIQPWKIILRGDGIVRLIYGKPKTTIDSGTGETKTVYPLEAVLTVLTTDKEKADLEEIEDEPQEAQWTLIIEHTSWTTDISGERIKHSIAEQERFGICCSIIDDDNDTGNENDKTDGRGGGGLTVYGANIKVELEQSPSSIPIRKSINFVPFIIDDDDDMDDDKQKDDRKQQEEEQQEEGRPTKRIKTDTTGGGGSGTTNNASSTAVVETRDLIDEVEYFASIIADTIGI